MSHSARPSAGRSLIALVLLAHGIGNSMGILQVLKVATVNPQWNGDSWILSGAGPTVTQMVGIVLWSAALIGFAVLAAIVVGWLPESLFAGLAVVLWYQWMPSDLTA